MSLKVLIVGAGVCGPALAYLLQRSNSKHAITVIERFSSLRLAGQQIDLKAEGFPIVKKMGLLDAVKAHTVPETGMEFVDGKGKPIASFGIGDHNGRGKGLGLTTDCEIMRGDLVKVFYNASLEQNAQTTRTGDNEGGLTYEFGKTITELNQNDEGVVVTFSDGQKQQYDLIVAADGQGSRTRRLAFGKEVSDQAFKSLGIHIAYYSIPAEDEGGLAKTYFASSQRGIMTRTSGRPMTQIYLFAMKNAEKMKNLNKEPLEKQIEIWAEHFNDAGWQSDRFVSGMKTCDDFFTHELAQVKMPNLHTGRVVLLGDAGYCPSLFTGMGTTASLIGAWILAGEIARHGNDVSGALKAYDEKMRPHVEKIQKMIWNPGPFFPSSNVGVWVLRNAIWAGFKVSQLIQKLIPERRGGDEIKKEKEVEEEWDMPDYPELNLGP